MELKLSVSNDSEFKENIKLIYSLDRNMKNFGLPQGIKIDLYGCDYNELLEYISHSAILMKFNSSTNNRKLFFMQYDQFGMVHPLEPHLNSDRTPRKKNKGKKMKFGEESVFETDLFCNDFKIEWDCEKWNISDTNEITYWTFSHFIELNIEPKQVFELEFYVLESEKCKPTHDL